MKKKFFCWTAVLAFICIVGSLALNSLSLSRDLTIIEIANIEALTSGEATILDDCFTIGYGTGEWGEFYCCDDGTTEYKVYPCGSKQVGSKGNKKKCVK